MLKITTSKKIEEYAREYARKHLWEERKNWEKQFSNLLPDIPAHDDNWCCLMCGKSVPKGSTLDGMNLLTVVQTLKEHGYTLEELFEAIRVAKEQQPLSEGQQHMLCMAYYVSCDCNGQ